VLSLLKRAAPTTGDDELLRSKIAARDETKRAITEKRASADRMQTAVGGATKDARESAAANRALKEFRSEYAIGGCKHSDLLKLQALENEAAEKAKVAERSAATAELVQRELVRLEDSIKSLELDLGGYEEQIAGARGLLLAQSPEASALLADLEAIADQYRAKRAQVRGLVRVLHPAWNEPPSPAKSVDGANIIYESLQRAAIKSWDQERAGPRARDSLDGTHRDEEMIEGHAAPWRARIAALREEPDAD
jgi:DNA repair exonuclease SbcCD ATPase subunit